MTFCSSQQAPNVVSRQLTPKRRNCAVKMRLKRGLRSILHSEIQVIYNVRNDKIYREMNAIDSILSTVFFIPKSGCRPYGIFGCSGLSVV